MKMKRWAAGTAFVLIIGATGCGGNAANTANNAAGFAGRTVGNAVRDVGNATGNAVGWTGRAVGNAVGGAGNAVGNAAGRAGAAAGHTMGDFTAGRTIGTNPSATSVTQSVQIFNAKRLVDLRITQGPSAGTPHQNAPGQFTRGAYTAGTMHRGARPGTALSYDSRFATWNDHATTVSVPVGWMVRVSSTLPANQNITILPDHYTRQAHAGSPRAGADVGGTIFGPRVGPTANRYNGIVGGPGTYAGTPGAYGGTTGATLAGRQSGYTTNYAGVGLPKGASATGIGGAHTGTMVNIGRTKQATFSATTPGLYAVHLGGQNGTVIAYIHVSNSLHAPSVTTSHSS